MTALDVVGPSEVLSRMPNTEVRFVGKELAPVPTESGPLLLGVTHTVEETPAPDLVLVPGGTTTPGQMVDDETLDWLRKVHQTTGYYEIGTPDWMQPGQPRTVDSIESQSEVFSELESRDGLKLEARKDPFEVLVVDQVERPSGN